MLSNAFRIIVNNLFKESFYEKRKKKEKKKAINVNNSYPKIDC